MNTQSRNLILLVTAFAPHQNHHTSFGEFRVAQYIIGLMRVQQLMEKYPEFDAVIVDNTIQDESAIDPRIVAQIAQLPRTKKVYFFDNDLPSKNKGCGGVIAWRAAARVVSFQDYQTIVHFEPRCLLQDFSFFEKIIERPHGYCLIEKSRRTGKSHGMHIELALKVVPLYLRQCNTDLFSAPAKVFENFINEIDIERMANKKINLEKLVYDGLSAHMKRVSRLGVFWHNAFKNEYIIF